MLLFEKIKSLLEKKRPNYSLVDTFGCPETPPQNCPTFVERRIHRQFKNALSAYNIIVVYGESRQGKTWTIDKYCPNQLRIGCTANMTIEQIKKEMLHAVGVDIYSIEHTIRQQAKHGVMASSSVGAEWIGKAGVDTQLIEDQEETFKATYSTIDFSIDADYLSTIKQESSGRFFVFDNFHYLDPIVQKQFCSLLKEFNYQGIKTIIVGVWKDSSRITAMAPDLVNRCEHIDVGSWSNQELQEVVVKGELALNIRIDEGAIALFQQCSAHNVGIFKSFLQKYCSDFDVLETQKRTRSLYDQAITNDAAEMVISESFAPLRDRIRNLALPQREKKHSKHMRLKIVCAVLRLIIKNDANYAQNGLPLQDLHREIDTICLEQGDESLALSNIIQELGVIHLREENRYTSSNFIPLFFYDKTNRKLLVIEPTLYQIREYNADLLNEIIEYVLGCSEDLQGEQMMLY